MYAAEVLNDHKLRDAADKMLDYLLYKAPKSANGIIYLTLNSPEIWIYAMYMAPPLLASIGKYDEKKEFEIKNFGESETDGHWQE